MLASETTSTRLYAALRFPNCESARIASAPPARPPRWPPIEIPGTANVNARLTTSSVIALPPST
jgi:hypothetical protein